LLSSTKLWRVFDALGELQLSYLILSIIIMLKSIYNTSNVWSATYYRGV